MKNVSYQPTAAALFAVVPNTGPAAIPQTRKMKRANVCAQQVAQNTTDAAMDDGTALHV